MALIIGQCITQSGRIGYHNGIGCYTDINYARQTLYRPSDYVKPYTSVDYLPKVKYTPLMPIIDPPAFKPSYPFLSTKSSMGECSDCGWTVGHSRTCSRKYPF